MAVVDIATYFDGVPNGQQQQHLSLRQVDTIHRYLPETTVVQQHVAAALIEEDITFNPNSTVTTYEPYIDQVKLPGKEKSYPMASQYASVIIDGQEAWFEVIDHAENPNINDVNFYAVPRLDIILGNTDSKNARDFTYEVQHPKRGQVAVRYVELEEEPLANSGFPRITQPDKLREASILLTQHLLKGQESTRRGKVKPHIPSTHKLREFIEHQTGFEPIFEASNGVAVGKGREVKAHLYREGKPTQLYVYPTQSSEGVRSYLIATKPFDSDSKSDELVHADGRMDFACGCQLQGAQADGHSCAHEFLGALRDATDGDTDSLTLVAWGGQEDKGLGSLMRSLKDGNRDRLQTAGQATSRRGVRDIPDYYRTQLPYEEHRPFPDLAAAISAGIEAWNVGHMTVRTGNAEKIAAFRDQIGNLHTSGRYFSYETVDPAQRGVPEHIVRDDITTRRQRDQKTYQAFL